MPEALLQIRGPYSAFGDEKPTIAYVALRTSKSPPGTTRTKEAVFNLCWLGQYSDKESGLHYIRCLDAVQSRRHALILTVFDDEAPQHRAGACGASRQPNEPRLAALVTIGALHAPPD